MKKHQEGYVLVYVLVVIVVLSALSVGILSHTLRNLRAQESAIAYEQEKYTAEGLIEQVVIQMERRSIDLPSVDSSVEYRKYPDGRFAPAAPTDEAYIGSIVITCTDNGTYTLTAVSGIVQITARITFIEGEVTFLSYSIGSAPFEEGGAGT